MNNRLLTTLSATALSLSLLAGGAPAQDLGLQQLRDSAVAAMARLNMDTAMVDMLTLEELTRIQSVAGSSESPDLKVQRIETILTDAETRIAEEGVTTPSGPAGDLTTEDLASDAVVKANVGSYLAQLGLGDEIDADMLTTDELLQVQLIQNGEGTPEEQRMQIMQMLQK